MGIKKKQLNERLKFDLDYFFMVNSEVKKRKVPCLILRTTKDFKHFDMGGNGVPEKKFIFIPDSGYIYSQKKEYFFLFVETLNNSAWTKGLPLIIDETGYGLILNLELKVDKNPCDITVWRNALRKYGLDLVPEERELEMLILTDK